MSKGRAPSFEVITSVTVYDSLNANASSFRSLIVMQQSNDTDIFDAVSGLLDSGSVSEGDLSVISGTLNEVNCSTAPNCTALNRGECFEYPHTCGVCLEGYVGEDGSDNSECVAEDLFQTSIRLRRLDSSSSVSCHPGCGVWEHCELDPSSGGGVCVRDSKECPDKTCSGHGSCTYFTDKGATINNCFVGSLSCSAQCVCYSGYAGPACSYSTSEFEEKISLREQSISALLVLLSTQDNSAETIASNIDSLAALCQQSSELSLTAASDVVTAVESIISASSGLSIQTQVLAKLFFSLATAMEILVSSVDRGYLAGVVDDLCSAILSEMSVGENPTTDIESFLRVSVISLDGAGEANVSVATPLTSYESALGVTSDDIILSNLDDMFYDSTVLGWVASLKSYQVLKSDGRSAFLSDIVRASFLTSSDFIANTTNASVLVTVHNYEAQKFDNTSVSDSWRYSVTTTCHADDQGYITLNCPLSGLEFSVYCNKTAGIFTTLCPSRSLEVTPQCFPWNETDAVHGACTLVSFDALSTTCFCPLKDALLGNVLIGNERRRLAEGDVQTLQFASAINKAYSFGDAAIISDFTAFDNSNFVAGTVTLYALTTLVIACGLAVVIGYCVEYQLEELAVIDGHKVFVEEASKTKGLEIMADGIGHEGKAIQVVEKALPQIFHGVQSFSWLRKIAIELLQYHRGIHFLFLALSPIFPEF
eukprot:CAMPEP_0185041100 /NCGR_PEP_ID=MMETSP1103-20130426/39958_1 /TAXON_ID=36769 /ORGANISM="Paraphysomonas bandaiensis, Strain Caron Lab Isolate" /LENGTH=707 /DNA_ID=CAMNT_0027580691 /DNA_START=57 /DNA_END=2177 /DNA_ORIENTATION=-